MKHLHIPAVKLYAGELKEYLDAIWAAPEPQSELPRGGDRIAAERIAGLLYGSRKEDLEK